MIVGKKSQEDEGSKYGRNKRRRQKGEGAKHKRESDDVT